MDNQVFYFYFTEKNPDLYLNLPLAACVQITQDIQQMHSSSLSKVTLLSPEVEGFPWPDVSKLRTIYTSLDCAPLTLLGSGCEIDNKAASRIQRAGSLDQKLVGYGWTNLQNRKDNSDYCISAQATLPNNKSIAVLEKVKTHANPSQAHNDVQIQFPMPREKMPLLSVTKTCGLYEDLDEAAFRTKPENRHKDSKTDQHGNATQHGIVKNLREKFLNLN